MNFSYTIICVENVQETVDFYAKAFELEIGFLHESKQYAPIKTGATKLSFASNSLAEYNESDIIPNNPKNNAPGFEIAFTCDSAGCIDSYAL